jgi:hypothetical protein
MDRIFLHPALSVALLLSFPLSPSLSILRLFSYFLHLSRSHSFLFPFSLPISLSWVGLVFYIICYIAVEINCRKILMIL